MSKTMCIEKNYSTIFFNVNSSIIYTHQHCIIIVSWKLLTMRTIEHYDNNNNSLTIILQYYSTFAEHDHMYKNNMKKVNI